MRRDPPDLRKLSRAVIAMALRDAEAEKEARDAMNGRNDQIPETATDSGESTDA
ncbi:hypothetical protein [Mycobacterium sp. 155]|uniref:hypothetical protein n=1 Tax=Mycobacterium sp. 155 TaxID=1157943 RepID=UPI000376A42F|nr:hypothetical protein [Mycobacterium sp. 155]